MTDSDDSVHIRNREKSSKTSNKSASNGSNSNSKDKSSKDKMKRVPGGPRPRSKKTLFIGIFVLCLIAWTVIFSGSSATSHSVGWWDENVYLRFGLQKQAYAVVLDAGSTGTRVLAFAFHQSVNGNYYRSIIERIFIKGLFCFCR
jgi:hypothetical protein